eukprot:scaffold4822_cov93-Skeletonema_dohrnii-CCMP3373.AAC.3
MQTPSNYIISVILFSTSTTDAKTCAATSSAYVIMNYEYRKDTRDRISPSTATCTTLHQYRGGSAYSIKIYRYDTITQVTTVLVRTTIYTLSSIEVKSVLLESLVVLSCSLSMDNRIGNRHSSSSSCGCAE